MTLFMLGLLVGVVIGRAMDLWISWKYPKPTPRKFEFSNLTILQKDETDESGNRTFTVSGGWLPTSGEFEIVIEGEHYMVEPK